MTDTYKVLGQTNTGNTGSAVTIYQAPNGSSAVASSLAITNVSEATATYSVSVIPSSEYNSSVVPESYSYTQGAIMAGFVPGFELGAKISVSADGSRIAASNTSVPYGVTIFERQQNGTYAVLGSGLSFYNEVSDVAISGDGNVVYVGVPYDDFGATNSGSVYGYIFQNGDWYQFFTFYGSTNNRYAGYSLATSYSGNRIAFSQPTLSLPPTGDYGDGIWIQVSLEPGSGYGYAYLTYINNKSCKAMAMSRDGLALAIGDVDANAGSGRVVLVLNAGGISIQEHTLSYAPFGAGQGFANVVDVHNEGMYTFVAVGAPYATNQQGKQQSGAVFIYLFDKNSSTWSQVGNAIWGEKDYENFGSDISMSVTGAFGTSEAPFITIAVGARGWDPNAEYLTGTQQLGRVSVYQYQNATGYPASSYVDTGEWVRISTINGVAQYDNVGQVIDMATSTNDVFVGQSEYDVDGIYNKGRVVEYNQQFTPSYLDPLNKHCIVKEVIDPTMFDEITGGITLSSGDSIVIESSADIAVTLSGVEIS